MHVKNAKKRLGTSLSSRKNRGNFWEKVLVTTQKNVSLFTDFSFHINYYELVGTVHPEPK